MFVRTTFMAKPQEIEHDWYVVDAKDKTLGRLATEIARVLRGKHKPIYTPSVDTGDYVIVVNAEKIALTGQKWTDKKYYHHSGYLGGLKVTTAEQMRDKFPERLLEKAVKGMLPHNRLGRQMYRKLKVYAGENHPHTTQKPKPLEF